ncbi:MAG: hypothetical protein WCP09_01885 [Candidatus Taylorbacteria bacterium]
MSKCKAVLDGDKITEICVKTKPVKKAEKRELKDSNVVEAKPTDSSRQQTGT